MVTTSNPDLFQSNIDINTPLDKNKAGDYAPAREKVLHVVVVKGRINVGCTI